MRNYLNYAMAAVIFPVCLAAALTALGARTFERLALAFGDGAVRAYGWCDRLLFGGGRARPRRRAGRRGGARHA